MLVLVEGLTLRGNVLSYLLNDLLLTVGLQAEQRAKAEDVSLFIFRVLLLILNADHGTQDRLVYN